MKIPDGPKNPLGQPKINLRAHFRTRVPFVAGTFFPLAESPSVGLFFCSVHHYIVRCGYENHFSG